MITKNQATHLKNLIRKLVEATVVHTEMDEYEQSERPSIIEECDDAEFKLKRYIKKLQRK